MTILHCILFNGFEIYIDVNPFQTLNKYVAGHLLGMSLAFSLMTWLSMHCEIWCLNDKYQMSLLVIQWF